MKTSGSRGIAAHFNFGSGWNWVVGFMPRSRHFRGTGYNWIWGRPQSRPRRGEKHKNHCPCRNSNPNNPARSLVTILTVVPNPIGPYTFFKSWRRMHAWQFIPEEQIQECFHPSLWYLRFLLPPKFWGFLPESFGFCFCFVLGDPRTVYK